MTRFLFSCVMCVCFAVSAFTSPAPPVKENRVSNPTQSPTRAFYRLDAHQSRFIIHVSVGALFSLFTTDRTIAVTNFTGEVSLIPGAREGSFVHMEINPDSLTVIDKVSESQRRDIEHRMRADVLETSRFQTITFKSTQIKISKIENNVRYANIWGELSLHGSTRPHYLFAQVELLGNDLRGRGTFQLRQTDYNIHLLSLAGGAAKIKDELKFSFDLVGHKE